MKLGIIYYFVPKVKRYIRIKYKTEDGLSSAKNELLHEYMLYAKQSDQHRDAVYRFETRYVRAGVEVGVSIYKNAERLH